MKKITTKQIRDLIEGCLLIEIPLYEREDRDAFLYDSLYIAKKRDIKRIARELANQIMFELEKESKQ